MKTVLSKPYVVIPLALAGLLVNGALLIGGLSLLGRVFSPEAPAEVAESEQTPSQPAADVEPAPAPEPPMVTLQDALPVGYEAAVMAQTAETEEEWNAVAKQWLAAIKILEEVPKTSPDYPAAKAKWKEYLKNVDIAGAKANAAAKASPAAYNTSTSLSFSSNQDPAYVTAEEFGDKWPFTVNEGRLGCLNTRVSGNLKASDIVFTTGGKTYALNGTAGGSGKYLDVEPIWKNNPDPFIPKISIGPMISEGLKLCGK